MKYSNHVCWLGGLVMYCMSCLLFGEKSLREHLKISLVCFCWQAEMITSSFLFLWLSPLRCLCCSFHMAEDVIKCCSSGSIQLASKGITSTWQGGMSYPFVKCCNCVWVRHHICNWTQRKRQGNRREWREGSYFSRYRGRLWRWFSFWFECEYNQKNRYLGLLCCQNPSLCQLDLQVSVLIDSWKHWRYWHLQVRYNQKAQLCILLICYIEM